MALRRQRAGEVPPEGSPVPTEEGQPIFESATRARDAGRRIFTCAVTVAATTGTGMGLGAKQGTKVQRWDPATLIEAIEALGWRLERIDHVWVQTGHNAVLTQSAIIHGLTVAHMQFRMSA